jgi:hypothetical protein
MVATDHDTLIRMAAFEHVRRLGEVYDLLTATETAGRVVERTSAGGRGGGVRGAAPPC